jgi:hypothetical protein
VKILASVALTVFLTASILAFIMGRLGDETGFAWAKGTLFASGWLLLVTTAGALFFASRDDKAAA